MHPVSKWRMIRRKRRNYRDLWNLEAGIGKLWALVMPEVFEGYAGGFLRSLPST